MALSLEDAKAAKLKKEATVLNDRACKIARDIHEAVEKKYNEDPKNMSVLWFHALSISFMEYISGFALPETKIAAIENFAKVIKNEIKKGEKRNGI